MKTRIIIMAAVVGLCVALSAGDLLAAGGGTGNYGQGSGTCIKPQGTMTRPADSRRRDGTFMTTGTTANGSTTRPGNGTGMHDGSGQSQNHNHNQNQNQNQNQNATTAPATVQ